MMIQRPSGPVGVHSQCLEEIIQMLKVATFTVDLPKQRRMRKKMFP